MPNPGGATLLHFLDGYYIKRRSTDPWCTSGAYCDVFIGDHPTFGKVALKRPRLTDDEDNESKLRNFILEGRVWKELLHPNILQFVGLIDSAVPSGPVWLVSVFAENGTLHQYMLKHPEADRHSLVLQLTSGLAYLHSKGVVHGDMKSPNLLVSSEHKLLISDFGLSKLRGMTTAPSKKGVGSVRWMAPELLFAENPKKTLSSDMYAYGITISEIVRGELPFKEYPTDFALINAIARNESLRPTMPQDSSRVKSCELLWAVAEDCWDPEPSRRPSMVKVCGRFSMDYTISIGDNFPSHAT